MRLPTPLLALLFSALFFATAASAEELYPYKNAQDDYPKRAAVQAAALVDLWERGVVRPSPRSNCSS